jgi:hypothetical protein
MSDDGFLSRWSRRKAQVRTGVAPAPGAEPASPGVAPAVEAPRVAAVPAAAVDAPPPTAGGEPAPPPTLEDVARLGPDADFSRFVAGDVDESVKRAAMKKLFADPHFNVMDGLDTYIDDYSRPDPIPESMLRRMTQSQVLGLFDDEAAEDGPPKASTDGEAAAAVPQSAPDPCAVPPDEDADLRLQQDHAAGPGGDPPGAAG